MPIAAGQVLNERYRLIRPVGQGSQASVWIAEHLALSTNVAVKLIDPELAKQEEARERFRREATAAAQLRSAHVVQILDHGIDGEQPFIVMELLEGEDLFERLERRHRLSLSETSKIVTQVARALTRAHAAGIVHRDLKPENFFLVPNEDDELVKILDFGVAKVNDPNKRVARRTTAGTLMGTPHYMSPEQVKGLGEVDHRADLWALGIIVYQCVTGDLPFDSEGVGDLLLKITIGEIPVPSKVNPELPATFDAWFARACNRERSRRFTSARDLAESLARVAGLSTEVLSEAGASKPTSAAPPITNSRPPPAPPRPALQSVIPGPPAAPQLGAEPPRSSARPPALPGGLAEQPRSSAHPPPLPGGRALSLTGHSERPPEVTAKPPEHRLGDRPATPSSSVPANPGGARAGVAGDKPSIAPSAKTSDKPSVAPSAKTSDKPSVAPSAKTSDKPSVAPSAKTSEKPSVAPSAKTSVAPSAKTSDKPSVAPSAKTSDKPSVAPSAKTSDKPSVAPSAKTSDKPSVAPSAKTSVSPSAKTSVSPSAKTSVSPSAETSDKPSVVPSARTSDKPSVVPSARTSDKPSVVPSAKTSDKPSVVPSAKTSDKPSVVPSAKTSDKPSIAPSAKVSDKPPASAALAAAVATAPAKLPGPPALADAEEILSITADGWEEASSAATAPPSVAPSASPLPPVALSDAAARVAGPSTRPPPLHRRARAQLLTADEALHNDALHEQAPDAYQTPEPDAGATGMAPPAQHAPGPSGAQQALAPPAPLPRSPDEAPGGMRSDASSSVPSSQVGGFARISTPPELDAGSRRRRLVRGFTVALVALTGLVVWVVVRSQIPPKELSSASATSTGAAESAPPPEPLVKAVQEAPLEPVKAVDPGRPASSAGPLSPPPKPKRKRVRKPADNLTIEIPVPPSD